MLLNGGHLAIVAWATLATSWNGVAALDNTSSPTVSVATDSPRAGSGPAVFRQRPPSGSPSAELYNGTPVKQGEYPALFFADVGCTASLVGEKAALTAAHCVDDQNQIVLELYVGLQRMEVTGSCDLHPDYSTNDSADVALCLLRPAVTTVAEFETLELSPVLAVGRPVRILGFGCMDKEMTPIDPVLAQGDAIVSALPTADTLTASVKGGVALCPGDSGGPGFFEPHQNYQAGRRIASVNSSVSAVEMPDGSHVIADELVSHVAVLSAKPIAKFLLEWHRKHADAKVCGLQQPKPAKCR
jgi:hypothetical protein